MNKKLIALAIAGAFAAPLAMADNGNVTIYGEFAGSVDSVDGGSYSPVVTGTPGRGGLNAATSERRGRVSSNNSFMGFKGKEDLGNNWSAIWQYEQSIAIDKQNINNNANDTVPALTSNQSRRTTFVGLSNKQVGTLTLGIHDTPYKMSTGPLDPFGQHTLADYRSIWGAIGSANVASIRAENSAMYTSPNLGGFLIRVLGAAQNEAGNDIGNPVTGAVTGVPNGHLYSVSGTYANGPIYGVLAYEDNRAVSATTPISDFTFKNWRAGFGYNFSGLKVGLAYERIKGDGTGPATAVTSLHRDAWYVPISYQMGSNTLKFAYAKAEKSNQRNAAGADLSGSDGAKQWSLGLDHAMSKRTNVYALYTRVQNDTNGSYSLGGGGTGIAAVNPASYGENPSGFSVGMVHKF